MFDEKLLKIFTVVSVLLILSIGCFDTKNPVRNATVYDSVSEEYQEAVSCVVKFKYKNHQYLNFRYSGHCADSGTEHDPDCPCFAKAEKNGNGI